MSEELTITRTAAVREGEFRDINTITTEIRTLYQTALRSELSYAVQLGRKLTEAKTLVEHGEWGNWIKDNLPFSQDKATMMMKIYDAYGANQESLFGDINSETFRNLGISQAFVLLSVPEDEREQFVKDNDVESMSVRELKKAIEERDAAITVRKALEEDNKKLRESNVSLNMKAQQVENLQKEAQKAVDKAKKAEAAKDTAVKELQDARAELAKAKADPVIPEEKKKEIRDEAHAEAKAEIAAAEAGKAAAEQKARDLEKQLALASPELTTFKLLFEQLQETQNRLQGCLMKIQSSNPETAEKLKKATMQVISQFAKKMEET